MLEVKIRGFTLEYNGERYILYDYILIKKDGICLWQLGPIKDSQTYPGRLEALKHIENEKQKRGHFIGIYENILDVHILLPFDCEEYKRGVLSENSGHILSNGS